MLLVASQDLDHRLQNIMILERPAPRRIRRDANLNFQAASDLFLLGGLCNVGFHLLRRWVI